MSRTITSITLATISFAMVALTATSASAQRGPRTTRVSPRPLPAHSQTMQNKMQVEQRMSRHIRQVHAGIMDGSLSWSETRRAFRGIEKVDKRLHRYLRDRRLTRREARKLNRMLDINGNKLAQLRRNRIGRPLGPVPMVQRPDRAVAPRPRDLRKPQGPIGPRTGKRIKHYPIQKAQPRQPVAVHAGRPI